MIRKKMSQVKSALKDISVSYSSRKTNSPRSPKSNAVAASYDNYDGNTSMTVSGENKVDFSDSSTNLKALNYSTNL